MVAGPNCRRWPLWLAKSNKTLCSRTSSSPWWTNTNKKFRSVRRLWTARLSNKNLTNEHEQDLFWFSLFCLQPYMYLFVRLLLYTTRLQCYTCLLYHVPPIISKVKTLMYLMYFTSLFLESWNGFHISVYNGHTVHSCM